MSEQEARGEHLETLTQRLRRMAWLISGAFVVVATGYWYVQIAQGASYRDLAENNRLRRTSTEAPRGLIFDRQGRLLVENAPSYNLLFDRSRSPDLDESLEFAATALGLETPESLREIVEGHRATPSFKEILIAEDLTLVQVARLEVAELEHPEFRIEVLERRLYRHGPQTAHLLGYLGEIQQEELARRQLAPGELVGREGVEQAYDERLRGVDGDREVVVDSRGRIIDEYPLRAAVPGEPLRLTVDLELQKEAAHLLEGKVGAIVALDPRDGAVRALVSAPSYDPNLLVRRLDREQWLAIAEDPEHPLQNRAIQNTYAPGSVFKIVMAVAAASEGVTHATRRQWCGGSIRLHDRRRRCWLRRGHGNVDLGDALRESCDVYFYVVGSELGIDRIADWSRRFGLGRPTGIELPGEKAGLVPDSEWSREVRHTPWYPGETVSVAIGQGPILTTPLQVAAAMAIAANGGQRVVPHLVEGNAPPPRSLDIDPQILELVRGSLYSVVNEQGTGASARVRGLEIAGKTGTAQVVEQVTWTKNEELPPELRDHAWFASFAPFDAPELVVVTFVEHGGNGSRAAAPLAKALYEKYLELR